MHLDLLDTVLVGRKDNKAAPGDGSMKDTSATAVTAAGAADEAKCPVDHKTRETWLQQARNAQQDNGSSLLPSSAPAAKPAAPAVSEASPSSSWFSWRIPGFSRPPPSTVAEPSKATPSHPTPSDHLGRTRVVSSIPRSSDPGPSSCPVNHEQETGASASGNWIYPSEKMFFDAMKRKGYDTASAADMKTVVPIHNAVNERAWAEILQWEKPYVEPAVKGGCGGPRLHSFAGLSERMSPKARINTLLGYTAPFDRHDWVVDRCGTKVEYVIDFYAGRPGAEGNGKVNFYLDVRPKLNTWEGVKMRALKTVGLV